MLLFGFAMVLIMIWKPRGLITTRDPSVLLDRPRRAALAGEPAKAPLAREGRG
jgi:branched-chain amino acid transport system permease protein